MWIISSFDHSYRSSGFIFVESTMPKKQFDCNNCGGVQEHPINSKCKMNSTELRSNMQDSTTKDSSDTNALILNELKSLSSRTTAMESKVNGASYSPQRSFASV